MGNLTIPEKAAIYLHVIENYDNWHELYKVVIGEYKYNLLAEKSRNRYVSTWKNSEKVKRGIDEIKYQLKVKEQRILENATAKAQPVETEPTKREEPKASPTAVNFLNPDEFLQFANSQANEIQDEKERREYLKMIANLMNYKESDNTEIEIQRFYTPMICENCEIYNKCKNCNITECPKASK